MLFSNQVEITELDRNKPRFIRQYSVEKKANNSIDLKYNKYNATNHSDLYQVVIKYQKTKNTIELTEKKVTNQTLE